MRFNEIKMFLTKEILIVCDRTRIKGPITCFPTIYRIYPSLFASSLYLLHRASINRIAHRPRRLDLQNRALRVHHADQIFDKPPIDHRSDLRRVPRRHITHNPQNILLLQLLRLRQDRNQHLQQSRVQHQLRVFAISGHDIPCYAQRRALQANIIHKDQSHEVRRVHEGNHDLLLRGLRVEKERKRPAGVGNDFGYVAIKHLLEELEVRLDVLEQPGQFLLVAAEVGEAPHAVFDHADFVQVALRERDDERKTVRLEDLLAVFVAVTRDVAQRPDGLLLHFQMGG